MLDDKKAILVRPNFCLLCSGSSVNEFASHICSLRAIPFLTLYYLIHRL